MKEENVVEKMVEEKNSIVIVEDGVDEKNVYAWLCCYTTYLPFF